MGGGAQHGAGRGRVGVPGEALLEAADALESGGDRRRRDGPVLDREAQVGEEAGDAALGQEHARDDQQVRAGAQGREAGGFEGVVPARSRPSRGRPRRRRPAKPSCARSRPPMTRAESEAGASGSSAGKVMCAVITAGTPARIAARNGTRSQASSSARLRVTPGRGDVAVLARRAVAGEVLRAGAHAGGRGAAHEGRHQRARPRAGSVPKLRSPTGQSGTESTSATGARFQLTPIASSSRLVAAATRSTRSGVADARDRAHRGENGDPLGDAHDAPLLLVDGDQQRLRVAGGAGRLLQAVGQLEHLGRVDAVLAVEDDAAEPGADQREDLLRGLGAVEPGDEQLPGGAGERPTVRHDGAPQSACPSGRR